MIVPISRTLSAPNEQIDVDMRMPKWNWVLASIAIGLVVLTGCAGALPSVRHARPDARMRGAMVRASVADRSNGRVTYSVPSSVRCATNTCVHWVDSSEDAPPPADVDDDGIPDRVQTTLDVLEDVWAVEVDDYGFRPPKSDLTSRNHGPDGRLDVYLADVGPKLYGYCDTDDPALGSNVWDVSAYCVFDNDFSRREFGRVHGLDALRSTAAHEFFHAIQAAYDWGEDWWLTEGTAAWIEDEVYDDLNEYDYFYGGRDAFSHPDVPVDIGRGWYRYGAWFFWRFMSEYFSADVGHPDTDVIKQIWELADASEGAPNLSSLRATAQVAADHGVPFRDAFATFGAVNAVPASFYEEGADYPDVAITQSLLVTPTRADVAGRATLDHLTSAYVRLRPGRAVPPGSELTVTVQRPER